MFFQQDDDKCRYAADLFDEDTTRCVKNMIVNKSNKKWCVFARCDNWPNAYSLQL